MTVSAAMRDAGADCMVMSGGLVTPEANIPQETPGYMVDFAAAVRKGADVPTMAVGMIVFPQQAEDILSDGQADLESYLADVNMARERGWAVDADNFALGFTTVAAAITDRNDTAHYCISNILFSGQAEAAILNEIGAEVAHVSRQFRAELYP